MTGMSSVWALWLGASAEVPRATQQALSGRCRALFKPLFQLERRMHRQGAAGDGAVKIEFHEFDICMNAVCMGDPVLWCILAARVRCKPAGRCQSCSLYPYTKTAPRGSQWLFRISRQISPTLLALHSMCSRALEFVEACVRVREHLDWLRALSTIRLVQLSKSHAFPGKFILSPRWSGNGGYRVIILCLSASRDIFLILACSTT